MSTILSGQSRSIIALPGPARRAANSIVCAAMADVTRLVEHRLQSRLARALNAHTGQQQASVSAAR